MLVSVSVANMAGDAPKPHLSYLQYIFLIYSYGRLVVQDVAARIFLTRDGLSKERTLMVMWLWAVACLTEACEASR